MKRFFNPRSLGALLVVLVVACGGEDEGGADADCDGPVPTFDEVTALQACTVCHATLLTGPDRNSAPSSINFDTYDAARSSARAAANAVNSGQMPPSSSGITLSEQEVDDLNTWAACGTPM